MSTRLLCQDHVVLKGSCVGGIFGLGGRCRGQVGFAAVRRYAVRGARARLSTPLLLIAQADLDDRVAEEEVSLGDVVDR